MDSDPSRVFEQRNQNLYGSPQGPLSFDTQSQANSVFNHLPQYFKDTSPPSSLAASLIPLLGHQMNLNLHDPFSLQLFSNQSKSEIQSKTVSNKNSFHTDDSQSVNPTQNVKEYNVQTETQNHISRQQSINVRNHLKSPAIEQNSNSVGALKENQSEKEEDIELTDTEIEQIKLPDIIPTQKVSFTNACIISIEEHMPSNEDQDSASDSEGVNEGSSSNSSILLDSSIKSYNLNSIISNSPSPFVPNSQIGIASSVSSNAEQQYQTWALGQSIWSPQVPPQTQQQFLQTQSQIVQQQNQFQYELKQKLQIDLTQAQNFHIQQQTQLAQIQQQPASQKLTNSPPQTFMNQEQMLKNQNMTTKEFYEQPNMPLSLQAQQQLSLHLISQLQSSQGGSQISLSQGNPALLVQPVLLPPQGSINPNVVNQIHQFTPDMQLPQATQVDISSLHQQTQAQQKHMNQLSQQEIQNHSSHHFMRMGSNNHERNLSNSAQQQVQGAEQNVDHSVQLQHLYVNRQINRHMLNPVYRVKGHKLEGQNSFNRNATASPMLMLPGNLSVLRPPPGFENTIPKNIQLMKQLLQNQLQTQQQLLQEVNIHHSLQQQQQQNTQILMQQIPNQAQSISQQIYQQQQQQQQHQMAQQALQAQALQQLSQKFRYDVDTNQQQQQQLQQQQIQQISLSPRQQIPPQHYQVVSQQINESPIGNENGKQDYPYSSGYFSFFGEQVQTKKSELDEQLRRTTQQLEHKLLENLEIQKMWNMNNKPNQEETDADDLEDDLEEEGYEEDQENQDEPNQKIDDSVEELKTLSGPDSQALVKSLKPKTLSCNNTSPHQFREQMLEKRTELFKKLQDQLHRLKTEMFQQNESGLNPKLNPFKQDPSKYLEKILNLMTIINEVDSHTNLQELKAKYDKTKIALEKVKEQRLKFFQNLSAVSMQLHDLEYNYQTLVGENSYLREKQIQEREHFEMIIKTTYENIRELTSTNDQQNQLIIELQSQIESEKSLKKDMLSEKTQENEKINQVKHDYCKKITEQQVEIDNLREYIKKRSQEEMHKRSDEKKVTDTEINNLKEQIEKMTKSQEAAIKDKDIELRVMKEHLLRIDPDFFNNNLLCGPEKIIQCQDCKKRDLRINDLEKRIRDLTDYIKQNKEIKAHDILIDLSAIGIVDHQQKAVNESFISHASQSLINQNDSSPITADLLDKFENLTDFACKYVGLSSVTPEIDQLRQIVNFSNYKLTPSLKYQKTNLEEIKEVDEKTFNSEKALFTDSVQALLLHFKKQMNFNQNQQLSQVQSMIRSSVDLNTESSAFIPLDKIITQERKESFFKKVDINQEVMSTYKEIIKQGKHDRKLCHQIIVEVEKQMYTMSSILVTESILLEPFKTSSDEQKKALIAKEQASELIEQRIILNQKLRDLFKQILENYLQLPLKLKLVYDKQKNHESLLRKFFNADHSIIQDLAQSVISQSQNKVELYNNMNIQLLMQVNDYVQKLASLNEQNEAQKLKVQSLNEKLVQVSSAYNAMSKHLATSKGLIQPAISIAQTQPQPQPQQKILAQTQQLQSTNFQGPPGFSQMPQITNNANQTQLQPQMHNSQILQNEAAMRQYIQSQQSQRNQNNTQQQLNPQQQQQQPNSQMTQSQQQQQQRSSNDQPKSQGYGMAQPHQQVNKKSRRQQNQPYNR